MALNTEHAVIFLGPGGKVTDLAADADDFADAAEFIDNVAHPEVGVSQNVDSYHIFVSSAYDTGQDLNHTLEALDTRLGLVE